MRRAVVALLLPVLAACGAASSGTASSRTSVIATVATPSTASAAPTIATPTTAVATTAGPEADGFPDSAFRVTAPVLIAPSGPGTIERPACRPADVTARATTRPVPDGVDGVIRMVGHACSLHVIDGPTALLGRDSSRLAISLDTDPPAVNPGINPYWGNAFINGDGLRGFSWSGSWCGPKPTYVLVPMADDPRVSPNTGPYGDLKVPLSGAVPECHGAASSVLRPGLPGGEGNDTINPGTDALPLPPSSWANLRASLTEAASGLDLRLTNTTDTAIILSPCPNYAVAAKYILVRGSGDEGGSLPLPCAQRPPTIPAHGSATYKVPGPDLSTLGSDPVRPGTQVRLQIAIAGIPTASIQRVP